MSTASTAHLQAELQRLRDLNQDLEAILSSSFDEIYVTDGAGVTLRVNQACQRLYGLGAHELIGRSVYELEKHGIFSPSATSMALRERRRVTILQRTRSERQVLVTATPVFRGGEIIRVVCNSRDVTELLDLREQLSEAEDLAHRYRYELATVRSGSGAEPGGALITPGLAGVVRLAQRIARVDSTVLLLGESGVGKDVLAGLIHCYSGRRDGPLVKINCGAIPPDLLESEMFGYEHGAFTGARREGRSGHMELAHGGILFLNEVAELPLTLQVKLLQVLQDRQFTRLGGSKPVSVDVRILAATNRDVVAMVKRGELREDLYYRLNVVPIRVPALRERPEDIPILALRFLERYNARYGLRCRFGPDTLLTFSRYPWPGNVRELENVVERLVVTAEQEEICPVDVAAVLAGGTPAPAIPAMVRSLRETLEETEAQLVRAAYRQSASTYQLARALGISQASAVRKVHKYVRNQTVN